MLPLTQRQAQVYAFLKDFFKENDQLPPLTHIADHLGVSSFHTALGHLRALEKRGYVEKNVLGKYRFTRI